MMIAQPPKPPDKAPDEPIEVPRQPDPDEDVPYKDVPVHEPPVEVPPPAA